MENLVLVDGNSVLYRAFYATPYLTTASGEPTNAVFGFVNMLLKIIADIKPKYMLVAFDRKEPTYRHLAYAGYKAQRKPMPAELVPQVDLIKKTLDVMGIARYECAGLEADDIIGSVAKRFTVPTVIITGDKDSFQLVDDTTSVYFTRKGISDLEIYNAQNFKEKVGIDPIRIIDLKACMGDSSDNIPGIKGIGEKGALSFIQTYGSLEGLYEHIDELKGKTKEKVVLGKEDAFMSKYLATINVNADIPLTLDDLTFVYPFPEKTRKYFLALEFVIFSKKKIYAAPAETENDALTYEKSQNEPLNEKSAFGGTDKSGEQSDEVLAGASNKKSEGEDETSAAIFKIPAPKRKIKAMSVKEADDLISGLKGKDLALFLSENVYLSDGETEYIILVKNGLLGDGVSFEEALTSLNPLLAGEQKLIVFDKKSLKRQLKSYGFCLNAPCDDVLLLKYIVDYTQRELSAEGCIERVGGDLGYPAFSLYCMCNEYKNKLKQQNCENIYYEIELPLCDILYEMEQSGFKVDSDALKEASDVYKKRINAVTEEIMRLAGCTFNLNSPKQLGEILFDKLGLQHGKKTKNGYSTSAEVLELLEDEHQIVPLILKYRQLQKLYSGYIEGFRPLIDKRTGLIHTVFNQAITSTGRLSSKEPNLQNIPVREDEGKEIRKFFIPRTADGVLVSADYSQIELRLLAHYSGCSELIQAFCENRDVHAITAAQLFGIDVSEVTETQRRSAKAVNFGIIYGMSEYGLSKSLKIPVKTAAEYIKRYFETYPAIKEYINKNVEFAKKNGYVSTAWGRRRVIPEINSPNYNLRSFGERAAMNMPLQGTAADIIKKAMIKVFARLKAEAPNAKLILQVHDELIVDCSKADEAAVIKILREEMEGAANLSVPLTVSAASGKNWCEAK